MTKANIKKTPKGVRINLSGHALRPSDGRDYNIGCAGISAISFSVLNSFRKLKAEGKLMDCKLEYHPGKMEMRVEARRDHIRDVRCYTDLLVTGLRMIESRYPGSVMVYMG